MKRDRILLRSGLTLAVSMHGSQGTRVLLGHCLGARKELFEDVLPLLSDKHAVAFDFRGQGESDTPPAPYSWDVLVEDVVQLADSLWGDQSTFVFVGVSMGGMLGMHLALSEHAHRLEKLVLTSTTAIIPPAGAAGLEERIASVRKSGLEPLATSTANRWLSPQCSASLRSKIVEWVCSGPAEGYIGWCGAIQKHNVLDRLSSITAPTLVICGTLDEGTNVAAHEKIRDGIPGARLEVLPNLSHALPAENPKIFAELLNAFI